MNPTSESNVAASACQRALCHLLALPATEVFLMSRFKAKNGRPIVLDNLPKELRPIVQVIDSFERNHKLGLVWEAQVGQGKLLVCSSDLLGQQDQPDVRQFFQSLLKYAGSTQFKPSTTVDMNDLEKLISAKAGK